jgi:hypothetical protein
MKASTEIDLMMEFILHNIEEFAAFEFCSTFSPLFISFGDGASFPKPLNALG